MKTAYLWGVAAFLLSSMEVPAHAAGTGAWTVINDPGGGRELATATRLQDGRVLVAGGENVQGALSLVELFNPTTNSYAAGPPMRTPRDQATATLLSDGRVLVVGGTSNNTFAQPLTSAEIYDPATDSWTSTGSLHQARFGEQAALLQDGRVLIMGGTQDVSTQLTSCEIWNPATGEWTVTASMAYGRRYSSAVTLPNGSVLEAGDEVPSELYNPATATWSITGSQPDYIDFTQLAQLANGTVLAPPSIPPRTNTKGPGQTYNPSSNLWTQTGSSTGRFYPAVAALRDGTVLVAGGCTKSCSIYSVNSVVRYVPGKRAYANVAPMTTGRQSAVAVTLQDGRVFVQGGFASSGPAGTEIYTP